MKYVEFYTLVSDDSDNEGNEGSDEDEEQDNLPNVDGSGDAKHFQWTNPDINYRPANLTAFRRQPPNGVLINTNGYEIVDYFDQLFVPQVYKVISDETNRYAQFFLDGPTPLKRKSRFHHWKATSADEIQSYIALEIAMTMCQKPSLEEYWSSWFLNQTPNFRSVMSCERFCMIRSFFHFANNDEQVANGEEGYDALFKIRQLLDLMDPKLLSCYAPDKNLSFDESMLKFKGRWSFKQYCPQKPTKWGIKEYDLADGKTGYILKHLPYHGKNTTVPEGNRLVTEQLVLDMVEGFEKKGHVLYLDRFFTSPRLAKELRDKGIGMCGTIKKNRVGMPQDLKVLKLQKGSEPVFRKCTSGGILVCQWMDTKQVSMISTVHTNEVIDKQVIHLTRLVLV